MTGKPSGLPSSQQSGQRSPALFYIDQPKTIEVREYCRIGPDSKTFSANIANVHVDQSIPEISMSIDNSIASPERKDQSRLLKNSSGLFVKKMQTP